MGDRMYSRHQEGFGREWRWRAKLASDWNTWKMLWYLNFCNIKYVTGLKYMRCDW